MNSVTLLALCRDFYPLIFYLNLGMESFITLQCPQIQNQNQQTTSPQTFNSSELIAAIQNLTMLIGAHNGSLQVDGKSAENMMYWLRTIGDFMGTTNSNISMSMAE